MNSLRPIVAGVALCTASIAYSAYDFYVKVKAVAQDAPAGPVYLFVDADSDGDGASDEGIIRLACTGSTLHTASLHWTGKGARDAASGQASGKQGKKMMGAPKIGEATAVTSIGLPKITPKIAKEHHGRTAASRGWEPITFTDTAAACAAAAEAAVLVKKSKSNISTN